MLKMDKRFNLIKAMKLNITIRAKILCIISWIFKVQIEVPDFEWKARRKKILRRTRQSFYERI